MSLESHPMPGLSCIFPSLKPLLITAGVAFFSLIGANQTQAGETVAYCEFPLHAVNIYRDNTDRDNTVEPPEASLNIRVFWREKSLVFADLPARRSHFFTEGFVYTSRSGISDAYDASLWTLFIPQNEGQPCLLFRNGTAFDNGEVTQRQSE